MLWPMGLLFLYGSFVRAPEALTCVMKDGDLNVFITMFFSFLFIHFGTMCFHIFLLVVKLLVFSRTRRLRGRLCVCSHILRMGTRHILLQMPSGTDVSTLAPPEGDLKIGDFSEIISIFPQRRTSKLVISRKLHAFFGAIAHPIHQCSRTFRKWKNWNALPLT